MLYASKTALCLTLSLAVFASVADAHMLRDREFDYLGPFMEPFDDIEDMLKDIPDTTAIGETAPSDTATDIGNTGSSDSAQGASAPVAPSPTAAVPSQPQPRMIGEAVEILNTYNKGGVSHGNARSPTFTLTEPMMLTYLQTYHWNGGRGTPAPGQIGLKGQGVWQAEGRPGMFDTPNAEWIATPEVILQPGTYTVVDSSADTWAHNSRSNEVGFVVVRAAPVSAAPSLDPILTERAALERLTGISQFKDWVLAVRANGNTVVYDVTNDPTATCVTDACNWCFRMSEDTPSHRTYFDTYCVDAMSGRVWSPSD